MEVLGLVNIPLWLIGILGTIISLYLYSNWKHSYWRRVGVPGPEPVLFLGNLGTIKKKGLFGAQKEWEKKYGKLYGTYLGLVPQLTISDPELAKEVLIKRFGSFTNRWIPFEPLDEQKGMLFFAKGEHWKFIRNTLTATFSSGKMRHVSPAVADCCEKLVENIKEQSKNGEEVIEIKHIFGCFTMDTIASVAFGIDINSQKDPNNEFVSRAIKIFSQSFTSPLQLLLLIFPSLAKLQKLIPDKSFFETFSFFKNVILSVIEDRKSENVKRIDLMQIMLNSHKEAVDKDDKSNMVDYKETGVLKNRGLTIDEVTANAFQFLLAGYDTTANTLSFLAYNLAMNPECQEKCIEEVDRVLGQGKPDYDNMLRMQYLDNCMNETLRMYGPASRTHRVVEEDCELAGYMIPKGAAVEIAFYSIHHDPEFWPDPYKFNPDRFLPEERERRHPYAFTPFGHGPRNCIGMRLAYLEAKGAMASILQKYRLVKCDQTEDPIVIDIASNVVRAKNGVRLKVIPR